MLLSKANIDVTQFPDGQIHVRIPPIMGDVVDLTWSMRSATDVLAFMSIMNAIDRIGIPYKRFLNIPYLYGARSDRHMVHGDSCDLKVVAQVINDANFEQVLILDPHSDVAVTLIDRAMARIPTEMYRQYKDANEPTVLVCPDAGVAKKISSLMREFDSVKEVLFCHKERATDGSLRLRPLTPGMARGKHCLIVDDLCDGGATFLAIADQLLGPSKLDLIVTHGLFSKGTDELLRRFAEIWTTDSVCSLEVTNLNVVPIRM